jgi:hypothetical protein
LISSESYSILISEEENKEHHQEEAMTDNPFDQEVEVPEALEDELDEVDVPSDTTGTEADQDPNKANAKPKAPARPPVPEGYVSPVAFAKILTEHLEAKGAENSKGKITVESNPIPPQMVYSYLKNAGETSKNPWPRYEEGQRKNLLKVDESLAWWDALTERVSASRANATAKAEKKNAKATETPAEPVVEAEAVEAE